MTASEGRFIARCFVTAVAGIVGAYGFLGGLYALGHGETGRGLTAFAIVGVCGLVTYLIRDWEEARLVSGVVSDADLEGLRRDALAGMSEEQFELFRMTLDEEAKRKARRALKR